MNWEAIRTVAVAAGTAALLGLLIVVLHRLRAVASDIRKVHIQQANIVGMLLKAGFRPARGGTDWRDDGDKTAAPSFTLFDWRSPEQRHR